MKTNLMFKTVRVIDQQRTAKRFRALRRKHEFTLQQVAEQMGVTNGFLAMLEHNKRKWTEEHCASFEGAIKTLLRA